MWENPWPPILHDFDAAGVNMSKAMSGWWTNFAGTLNPNVGNASVPSVQWPQYSASADAIMQLEKPPSVTTGLLQSTCDMWDSVMEKLGPYRVGNAAVRRAAAAASGRV